MPIPCTTTVQGGARRLVLGFDAGCMTFADLAARIEEAAGDRLEVLSLSDPQVAHWREQTLGEAAPWAPTLFETKDGDRAQAWTGPKMGVQLARRLGPVTTLKVMRIVGEARSARKTTAKLGSGLTRGQFLAGGLGGTAVAFGVLLGVSPLARAAETGAKAKPTAAPKPADLTPEQRRVRQEFIEKYRQTPVGREFTLVNEDGKKLTFKRTAENSLTEASASRPGRVA